MLLSYHCQRQRQLLCFFALFDSLCHFFKYVPKTVIHGIIFANEKALTIEGEILAVFQNFFSEKKEQKCFGLKVKFCIRNFIHPLTPFYIFT